MTATPKIGMALEQRHRGAGLLVALAVHAAAIYGLMRHSPVRSASDAPQPLKVVLLAPVDSAQPPARERPARAKPPAPEKRSVPKPIVEQTAKVAAAPAMPKPSPSPAEVATPEVATPTAVPETTAVAGAPSLAASSATAAPAATTDSVASAPPAPGPRTVSGPSFSADYLQNPAPRYPPLARRMGQQGKVVLRVLVNPAGMPAEIELRTSSGSDLLDAAALDAVKRWRFVPARRGEAPVPAWVLVPITFTLQG